MKAFLIMNMAACALALAFPGGPALAKPARTAGMTAQVQQLGPTAQVQVAGAEGWVCRGDVPSGSSRSSSRGKSSGSGAGGSRTSSGTAQQTVWLKCSDKTNASARVRHDAGRREWTIWFNHKTHGRAELRVRDN